MTGEPAAADFGQLTSPGISALCKAVGRKGLMDVELHQIVGSAPGGRPAPYGWAGAATRADGAVRDVGALVSLGLPVWIRWVRSPRAGKDEESFCELGPGDGGRPGAPGQGRRDPQA